MKAIFRTILTLFFLILILTDVFAQNNKQNEDNIRIFFNDSASRYVLENPLKALNEKQSIWNIFEGYRITLVWHKESSFLVTWDLWEKGLNRFMYKDTSLIGKTLGLTDKLMVLEKREHEGFIKHISSYLPPNTAFNAYVYFVAFTIPYAFCVEQNKIGIDITADEWYFDPECLFNMIIHEVYHVGYRVNSTEKKYIDNEPENIEQFIRFNYAYILSEGMATYVAYKALELFPSNYKHDDYKLLEDDKKVKNAFIEINKLLEKTKADSISTLKKEAWDIGVGKRAYYISGAYMCQTIENKFGKKYLVELLHKGGQQFIKKYNELASDNYKINFIG
jgi:hypothetical protein